MFDIFRQKVSAPAAKTPPPATIDSIVDDFISFSVKVVTHRNEQFWREFKQSLLQYSPPAASHFDDEIKKFGKYPLTPVFIGFCAFEACAIQNIFSETLAERLYERLAEHLVSRMGNDTAEDVLKNISFVEHCAREQIALAHAAVAEVFLRHLTVAEFLPTAETNLLASDFFFKTNLSQLFMRLASQADGQLFEYWHKVQPLAEAAALDT